jgi:hypothetical protein
MTAVGSMAGDLPIPRIRQTRGGTAMLRLPAHGENVFLHQDVRRAKDVDSRLSITISPIIAPPEPRGGE